MTATAPHDAEAALFVIDAQIAARRALMVDAINRKDEQAEKRNCKNMNRALDERLKLTKGTP